ncbi:hypothetical protein HOY82DRAFT_610918 [Tuber indicum]|nr:hypothetical protein HOY82DRAFT_610918 [Tuber indicum]
MELWSHLNRNGVILPNIARGTPMGFKAIAYTCSATLEDCIKDSNAPRSPLAPRTAPSARSTAAFRSAMSALDLEDLYVAFLRGIDHCADTMNKINPTMDDFSITPVDGEPDTPIQSSYTMHKLRNYSLTLPRIILPSIKRDSRILLNLCTPTGSIERWVVPMSPGKSEYREVGKSGASDLWALGAKARTNKNIKVGGGRRKNMSILAAIKKPHGDGVRAIVRDKTTSFPKAKKKQAKELKKAASLQST